MPHGENLAFGVPIVTRDVFNFLEALEMTLQVNSWSNEARTVQVRGYTRHGFISHDHTTNADRSVATDSFRVQDFPLEFQVSTTDTSVRRGELFVRVNLMMGGFNVGCLCAGYVTDEEFPCYPVQQPYKSIDGRGLIRSIAGTDPAAGAEFSETVPTNARWRVLAVIATLVADATVITRTPSLVMDDGTTVNVRTLNNSGQTASQTLIHQYFTTGANVSLASTLQSAALLTLGYLTQGFRIRSITTNLQAGDNWGAPQLLVEEWIEE